MRKQIWPWEWWDVMRAIEKGLWFGLVAVLIVVFLQASTLLAQLGETARRGEQQLTGLVIEVRNNQNVLAAQGQVALNEALAGYKAHRAFYEQSLKDVNAISANLSDASASLKELVPKLDERTEVITRAAGQALLEYRVLANHAHEGLDEVMKNAIALEAGVGATLLNVNQRIADPRVDQVLDESVALATHLSGAGAEARRGLQAGADAAESAERAAESIDPGRSGPLRWLWKFLW